MHLVRSASRLTVSTECVPSPPFPPFPFPEIPPVVCGPNPGPVCPGLECGKPEAGMRGLPRGESGALRGIPEVSAATVVGGSGAASFPPK